MTRVTEIVQGWARANAPLYWNHANQLRRAVGPYVVVYDGGPTGGTVKDADGKCWDWWPTETPVPRGPWAVVRVVPAA